MLPIDEDEYGTYIMNSRDICLLSYIQELADAGVVSFKVEGRSKTVNYLAGVGRAYRPALDAVEKNEKAIEKFELALLKYKNSESLVNELKADKENEIPTRKGSKSPKEKYNDAFEKKGKAEDELLNTFELTISAEKNRLEAEKVKDEVKLSTSCRKYLKTMQLRFVTSVKNE